MSIRAWLLLLILFSTLIPALVSGIQFLQLRESEIADGQDDMSVTAQRVVLGLQDTVRATAQLHYGLSRARDLDTRDKAACSTFLANVLKEHPQYTGILTIKPDGELFCDSLRSGRKLNLTDRGYFQNALRSENPLAIEPVFGRLTGNAVLQIAYASRYESGALADVILASLDLNKYMQSVAKSLPRKTAIVAFVDAKGTILAWHPGGSKLPGTSIEDAVLLRFVREQTESVPREFTEEGEMSRIWAVSTMSDFQESGLRVLVGISKNDLLAAANQNLYRALWIVAVVTLLVFLGAWTLVELGIRRQAARIVAAVAQFGAGNFDARIGAPYPSGEIGDLMGALDHAFARISRLSRMHAVLSGINAVIVRVRDRHELFEQACRVAVEQGQFGTAWIGAFNASKLEVLPVAWAGKRLDPDGAPLRTDVAKGRGVLGRAIREKRPVVDNDIAALSSTGSERWARAIQAGYRSLVALPFVVEGVVAGHLSLYSKETDFFSADELKLLTDMADNIAFALAHIDNAEKIARLSRIHAVMSGINAAIVHFRDRQQLFDEACRIAVEHGGFGIAWIGLLNLETLDIAPAAWAGVESEVFLDRIQSTARPDVPGGMGVIGRAMRERRVAFSNDLAAELDVGGARRKEAFRRGYHSTITLPLFVDGAVVGNLSLFARERNFFDSAEVKLLTDLAENISFALDNISRAHKLDKLARIRAVSSEINAAIVRVRDREVLLRETCRIAVEHGKFELVWIALVDHKQQKVQPIVWAGFSPEAARAVSWSGITTFQGMLGKAMLSGKPAVRNDLADGAPAGKLRQEALQKGSLSTVCLPLTVDGQVVALVSLFAAGRWYFDTEELVLLQEVSANVSFALQAIEKQEKLAKSETKLDSILSTLQEVVWSMDPQSGHIVYVNAAIEQLTRLPAADFLAQPGLWRSLVHHDDVASMRSAIRTLLRQGKLTHEFRIVLAGGEERTVESSSRVRRDEAGKIVLIDGTISDITEHKHAEEAVKKERALLRAVVDAIPERIYVKDREGRYLLQNSTNMKVRGVSRPEEILGKTVFDIFPREQAERVHAEDELVMTSGTPLLNREGQTVFGGAGAAGGQTRWHLASKVPLKDEAGNIYGLVGVNRDITDRKRVETERTQLAAIVASSNDAIIGRSLDGLITSWNVGAERMFGYSKGEMLGRSITALVPEGQRNLAENNDGLLRGEVTPVGERMRITKDGRVINVLSSISPVRNENGLVVGAAIIVRDITDLKRAENQLRESEQLMRATFENAAVGIVHTGLDDRYLRVNAKFCELLGYTREELQAMTTKDTNHPDELDRFGAASRSLLLGEVEEFSSEKRFVRKDGSAIWAKRTVSLVHDATGAPLYFIRVIEDISARKAAETALRRLNEELEGKIEVRTADLQRARHEAEKANHAKSSFLAAMSHEIRTPMNGVIGMIDVLHQTSLKGDQVEMIDLIRESAFSLLGIINDILDFSKIEAGKLELEREALTVADVVESVCSLLNGMADKKDVAFTLYVDPAIPAQVLGDSLRLRQVLTNLVNNAIKFSGGQAYAGRVSVRALLIEQSEQQVRVEFRVTDNGIGIDDETQARLFTAFTQADATTTRQFGGTGLGLAISNHLVELMGGEITVQSALGKGATFKARLSFERVPAVPKEIEAPSAVAGLSCVVVGDVGGLADDLAAYLKHAHAVVERALDLASARVQTAGWSGLSVWVVDAGEQAERLEQMRTVIRAQIGQDVRVVVVLSERGTRHQLRVVAPDMITVDGNVLSRRTFLRSVAAVAGRASLEIETEKLNTGRFVMKAPSRDEALRQGRLILIAEDNQTNQKVISRQLALLGYTADIAADGREALERWRSGDYALLFTDLHMPKMDGYELTQAIRDEEKGAKRMPIIALTANALKGEAEHCRAVGMDDYRSKPSPLAELKAVLDKWLPAAHAGADASILSTVSSTAAAPATAVPVDVRVLEGLVGNEPGLVREFLQQFRTSAAKIADELRAAYATSQITAIVDAAHKLRSSALAVGAMALGELCAAMEEEGKAGGSDALTVLLPRFEAEMTAVENYLDKW